MVKLDKTIAAIDGQTGGDVFRHDVCGQHIQKPPRHVKSLTPNQIRQNKAFLKALYYCGEVTTFNEHFAEWWEYAIKHPKTNIKGEKIILTPFTACLRINTIRFRNNLDGTPIPPT